MSSILSQFNHVDAGKKEMIYSYPLTNKFASPIALSILGLLLGVITQPFQGGNLLIVGEIIFKCFLLKAMPENVPLFKVKVVLQVPCQDEK